MIIKYKGWKSHTVNNKVMSRLLYILNNIIIKTYMSFLSSKEMRVARVDLGVSYEQYVKQYGGQGNGHLL